MAAKKLTKLTEIELANIAHEFVLLKQEVKEKEARLEAHRLTLLEALRFQDASGIKIGKYTISETDCERENFSMKAARENLDAKVFAQTVGRFISTSTYKRLSVV